MAPLLQAIHYFELLFVCQFLSAISIKCYKKGEETHNRKEDEKMNGPVLGMIAKMAGKVFEAGLYAVGMNVMREGQNNATDAVVGELKRGGKHLGKKYNLLKYEE